MDGHFVPNLTLGAPIIKCLRKHTDAFLDCHLMVSNPQQWVEDFAKAGASQFTFHIEANGDAKETIKMIKEHGMKAGIAVKPGTSVDIVIELAAELDMVLIMTVEPGFGGQSFMPEPLAKVKALRARYPELNIQVDGGLSPKTIDAAAEAGANVIVAGSAVFGAEDRAGVMQVLRDSVAKSIAASS
eukprot:TRINITY_DN1190_c0_g1_i2.p1 TRINITY_DN1190_c0_g1~~TRINITY_DN1190_c0_g1_i2.p1  ORF type:complete len:186 (+),score=43.91 TRINITY_DN1190_c0_g1_i2:457-1014(+)